MAGQRPTTVEELLVHAGWLRGLARHLAKDPELADDAVQDTWIAALRRAPEAGESMRPWLAQVLRNAVRMRARGDGRRAARERAAQILGDEAPTPEALVARAEAQRLLADLVLRLDEPYRSTVLLHYGEELSLAEIARSQGIAAGTARWRLKVALDRLREQLDTESGGRRGWVLAPLVAIPKGALVAQKSTKITAAVLILLALLAGGVALMIRNGGSSDGGDDEGGERAASGAKALDVGRPAAGRTDSLKTAAWLTQPGAAPRRIAGRVTFRGAPVAGATVELASLASESGLVTAPRARTGASGEFDFGLRPAMQWSVRASAPGKTGVSVAIDLRNPVAIPRPDRIVIELGPCEAALVGTVRDASGGAIAGARLARLSGGRTAVPGGVAVQTDADGAYELCVDKVWPPQVVVEVSAAGYGAIVFRGLVYGRVEADFALVPEAVIAGQVIRDDTGAPVAGAHVFLEYGPWGIESTSWRGTFTDSEGRFRLDQVAPGRHVLRARAEGLAAPRRGTPVVVEAGQTTAEIEIRMEAGAVVRGVVVDGDEPVAGARVAAIGPGGVRSSRTAVSQEDGSFALDEVPRGQVRFTAWPYDIVKPASFVVERGEHDGVVIEVEALAAIAGKVIRDELPVAGALVQLHGPNERQLGAIYTDDRGEFEARGLQPGPWIVFGSDDGAFGRAPETVHLERGETEEVTIDLAYAAAISGVVVDQNGAPVPGVSVEFTHTAKDDIGVAVTSTDGSFRAALMTGGGQYRTTVRRNQGPGPSLPPARGTELPLITLAGGDSEVTGVVLAVQIDRLTIAGRVVDTAGAPVADARVTAAMVDGGVKPRFLRYINHAAATTDVDGRFSIGELSAGTYALRANAPSGEVTVDGVSAGRTDVVITMPAPGAIEGTVAGFRSRPDVIAQPADIPDSPPARGRVAGQSFSIEALSPGRYVVTARTATESASAQVTVAAGAVARLALTSGGTGVVTGRVREFRTGDPVEGMTCRAHPRLGEEHAGGVPGDPVRTDAQGAFRIPAAPGGAITVICHGLSHLYSNGMRLVELPAGGQLDVDVPVVARRSTLVAGFGASIDVYSLVPDIIDVRPGGPAATAGLRDGDRVIAVDGADVTELSPWGVQWLITNREPGTKVALTVRRGGRTISTEVVLIANDGW